MAAKKRTSSKRRVVVPFVNKPTGKRFSVAVVVPVSGFGVWTLKPSAAAPRALKRSGAKARVTCSGGGRLKWSYLTAGADKSTYDQAITGALGKLSGTPKVRACLTAFAADVRRRVKRLTRRR